MTMFFNNPRKKSRVRKARTSVRARKRRVRRRVQSLQGASMARGRKRARRRIGARRRRKSVKRSPSVALRRRGVTVYRSNPRRRRRGYRRNPFGVSARGIVGTVKDGVRDGAVVLASQVATARGIDMLAPKAGSDLTKGYAHFYASQAGRAVLGLAVPTVIAMAAHRFAPKYSRMAAAGAFAQGLHYALSGFPQVAGFLNGYISDGEYTPEGGYGAYEEIGSGMSAYPAGSAAHAGGAFADYDE